jgi:hypothetical protein
MGVKIRQEEEQLQTGKSMTQSVYNEFDGKADVIDDEANER